MKTRYLPALAAAAILMTASNTVFAQAQTNGAGAPLVQTFRITVPKNITITCPDVLVDMIHNGADANQTFVAQQWEVKGNSTKGVNVTFTLNSPFTIGGSIQNHQRRDASLAILPGGVQGPATWTNGAATIATDISSNTLTNTWATQSNGVGRSTFTLTMTFVNQLAGAGFGAYQEGVYESTVTGEVTENP